ncbi:MAG TPA: YigZ family protein [Synergistales bacterium]|jgi:uncharacterized YigZ family protein|nr:YigZ family protein [Synergistales bacterium]HRV71727.1 YigZ family protein [Thermovirgaceae bacterium]
MSENDRYIEPARETEAELKEKRSLFIGRVIRAYDEIGAKDAVKEVSRKFPDATHNCWAYRVGFPQTVEYYSDAGEPSGTAGKPILGAILRSGLVNVVVVVTRYFGGTKLGVRGLIDAYGKSASMALEAAGKRNRVQSRLAFLRCPYEHAQMVTRQLVDLGIPEEEISHDWGEMVGLRVSVPVSLAKDAESLFEGYGERGLITNWKWQNRLEGSFDDVS